MLACLQYANTKAPLQRSRSRQNMNVGSAAARGPPAKEAHYNAEGHPSAAQSKAAACVESGQRYRHVARHSHSPDRESTENREREKVMKVEAEAPVPPNNACTYNSNSTTNGESDVEALLARLRAL